MKMKNVERTKKADHILKMAGLGLFCGYRFIKHICIFVKLDWRELLKRL